MHGLVRACLAGAWAAAAAAADPPPELYSEIRVAKNGELTVTERITLESRAERPALVRELPKGAQIVDVVRNGHPEPWVVNADRLRVGGALPAGRHFFQITYRHARGLVYLGDHDALHWSLKAGGRVTGEVILPGAVPAAQIRVEATGGPHQSFVRDGRAAFRSRGDLAIVVRFPKAVVDSPGVAQQARWALLDYWPLLAAIALVVAVFFAWRFNWPAWARR